jgi:WD40 repeat protein
LSFDESGRMVLHDMTGLRVYTPGSIPAESPPAFWIPISLPQGFAFWRAETAKTPDGKIMALARLASIYLWHAESPGQLTQVELSTRPAVEPAKAVARRQSQSSSEPQSQVFRSIQVAPGGDRVYTTEQVQGPSQGSPSVVRAWELTVTAGAKTARAREVASVSLPDGWISSALSRDGKTLAVADRTGQVTLLDAAKLTNVGWLQSSGKEPESYLPPALAISPDGTELAVGSQQGTISLWSISAPARPRLRLHLPGHRAVVASLVYDPQARRLASATTDSNVEVWDLEIIDRALGRLRLDN